MSSNRERQSFTKKKVIATNVDKLLLIVKQAQVRFYRSLLRHVISKSITLKLFYPHCLASPSTSSKTVNPYKQTERA
jgi:hypothetical protein